MLPMGLNHMSVPNAGTLAVLNMAKSLDCVGVELRNDLKTPLFGDLAPDEAKDAATRAGLRILALAEVYGFNDNSDRVRSEVLALSDLARQSGAEAIVLIPRIETGPVRRVVQRRLLKTALAALQPIVQDSGIKALIEPLGFPYSSLRYKADVERVLDDLGRPECFALVHDTFHHALAEETDFYPDITQIVHISGVSNPAGPVVEFADHDRGLVTDDDRLGTVAQVKLLRAQGYRGPFSFEAFAPAVHSLADPKTDLSLSIAFIASAITERVM